MSKKPQSASSSSRRLVSIAIICCLIIGGVLWFLSKNEKHNHEGHQHASDERAIVTGTENEAAKRLRRNAIPKRDGDPAQKYDYVYDKAPGANRFLVSKGRHESYLPDSDAPAGRDLWIVDESGVERRIADNVYRARFSPDGNKIAFATADCELHVQDMNGNAVAKVDRAYEPSWRPDSSALAYARVPEDRPLHNPEVLQLATYDLATGKTKILTDGTQDDVRPHYDPSGKWILFVSGGRSGLASFYQIPESGGEPRQVTNRGLEQVNELFVPTPYDRTIWSQNRDWFVYDFKRGEIHETWGLQFDPNGGLKQAKKIGEGLDPQWKDDGRTVICLKQTETGVYPVEYTLP